MTSSVLGVAAPLRFVAPAALVLSLLTLVPKYAHALGREGPLGGTGRAHESPQRFAVELRFALFKPEVDSDPTLAGAPFNNVFGGGSTVEVGGEFDWQAIRIAHVGTLGPGFGAAYAKFSGNARFAKIHNGTYTSGESTSLEIFPLYGAFVLRADALWRELHIPIIPYAKAGVGFALWRASNTLGTSHAQGVSGEGHSLGTHFAAGIALSLNPFDEYAVKTFDDAMGVNNTLLFAEWMREDLAGLGIQNQPLRVGGTSWVMGFALEF